MQRVVHASLQQIGECELALGLSAMVDPLGCYADLSWSISDATAFALQRIPTDFSHKVAR